MLRKLVTEYRQILIERGGDAKARGVFTNSEYAAKESETLRKNKDKKRARTFNHDGKDIEMFQHLKIGTSDDITQTIRVHFHWDADRKKIVIGYCGEHLPISSH